MERVKGKASYRAAIFAAVVLTALAISPCKRSGEGEVVARIGSQRITLRQFRAAYINMLRQPDKFDSPEVREAFLDEMINRTLLAGKARELEMDADERFTFRLRAYRMDQLKRSHYRHLIQPRTDVSDEVLREIFRYTQEQRRVKHLYFRTLDEAERAYRLLENGHSFDRMAEELFDDEAMKMSGGELGWVYWDQMEYDMAMTAYRQEVGTFSKPVATSFGYHILKVLDYKAVPLISEYDYRRRQKGLRYLAASKLGEKIAFEYIADKMEDVEIKIVSEELRFVRDGVRRMAAFGQESSEGINRREEALSESKAVEESLWKHKDETLLYIDGKAVCAGEFIAGLRYLPKGAMLSGFKTVLDYFIRDYVLAEEAIEIGLESDPEYLMKCGLYEDYLLQMAMRKSIIDAIEVADDEIDAEMREIYRGRNISGVTEEEKDAVRRFMLRDRKSTEVPSLISKLRKGVEIKKRTDLLHEYYEDLINS